MRAKQPLPSEPPTAKQSDIVGVGWYSPGFFRALRKAGLDPAPGCADWDAWFATYQATFVRLKDEGHRPVKVVIDPGDLARWLAAVDRPHSLDAHADFVAIRLADHLGRGGEP